MITDKIDYCRSVLDHVPPHILYLTSHLQELAGAIARIVYAHRDGGECTMQQLLIVTEWLLETLDILNSYTNVRDNT